MSARKLTKCQGCAQKVWVDFSSGKWPKHTKADRMRCPMSQQPIEEGK
jgi:hypothetical protein